jgi:hypothetical protein
MVFAIRWDIIIELSLLFLVLATAIAISAIVIIRRLHTVYRDVYRHQSKFDIELRKSVNLISKSIKDDPFIPYENAVIKDLPYSEKSALLELVDKAFNLIDFENPTNRYVIETHDNLHEIRRILDSKILEYNQLISLFPFSLYARILKMKKIKYYTHKE